MRDWGVLLRPTPKRILEVLLTGPKTLGELAAATGLKKPSLLAHLKALEELGAVSRSEERTATGREVRFTVEPISLHLEVRPRNMLALSWGVAGGTDEMFPLVTQVPGDAERRLAVAGALGGVWGALGGFDKAGVVAVLVFGSFARGEATWKSDIDLLFVLEERRFDPHTLKIKDAIAQEQPMNDYPVRPHFATLTDYMAGAGVIVREAQREGLVVYARPEEGEIWERVPRYRHIWI